MPFGGEVASFATGPVDPSDCRCHRSSAFDRNFGAKRDEVSRDVRVGLRITNRNLSMNATMLLHSVILHLARIGRGYLSAAIEWNAFA